MAYIPLYNLDVWNRYVEKHGITKDDFEIKTYPQFDPSFNFYNKNREIKKLVSDPTLKKVSNHSFIPFVKILIKTPRYRYQENIGEYTLETKIRPISFASHFDTYLYGFYSFALTERYQNYIKVKGFSNCVLAYRTDLDGKCNIQFAKEVFDNAKTLIKKNNTCTAIALDISGYFDNIDHKILKNKWCKILDLDELPIDQYKIFRSLTEYSYANKNSVLKHFKIDLKKKKKLKEEWYTLLDLIPNHLAGPSFNEKMALLRKLKLISKNLPKSNGGEISYRGIPQGSPMSALLSNIYLIDFDEWLYNLSVEHTFIYRRYCDDLLIICDTEKSTTINDLILKEIKKYHLSIQTKKTDIINFKADSKGKVRGINQRKVDADGCTLNCHNEQRYYKNLQYLGFEFSGSKIYIRPGSLSRFFRKAKARIVKTIMMAYSDRSKFEKIHKKQLYERYSHLGGRNFITYAKNASSKVYKNSRGDVREGMDSVSIKKQLSSHFSIIEQEVFKTSAQRFQLKEAKQLKRLEAGKKTKPVKRKY